MHSVNTKMTSPRPAKLKCLFCHRLLLSQVILCFTTKASNMVEDGTVLLFKSEIESP